MKVIYIDVLFAVNLIINYLLLLMTMRFGGVYAKRSRLFLSAFLGAFYCVLFFVPELGFLYGAFFKLAFAAFMVFIGFYKKSLFSLAKLYIIFVGLSAALAGGVIAFYWLNNSGMLSLKNGVIYADISLKTLFIASGLSFLLVSFFLRHQGSAGVLGKKIKPVEITLFGKKTVVYTLLDTGNELRDPITGKRVLVAEYQSIRECLPLRLRESIEFDSNYEASEIFERASRMGFAGALRLLPFKTVSGRNGNMMIVMKPDAVQIEEKPAPDIILGLTFEGLKGAKGYSALVGI
ncbi:MAG: sigma-E processing peptidase SpoIIGA [Bacillota bacterium]|nr:sigma-E processing peptidase SpoIIGA [Bacillota bacterium]